VVAIFAGTQGFADHVAVDMMGRWQAEMLRYMESAYPEIVRDIAEKKMITDDTRESLMQALQTFRDSWTP
jgi:F-type H+-transporting ATPase subunit alpha